MVTNQYLTNLTRSRYQRISPFYDRFEEISENSFSRWRQLLWSNIRGQKILEVGVGTGNNMPYYPPDKHITAIDLTPGMLSRARKRAIELDINVSLNPGDVQNLDYSNSSFDSAVATFVFCSVPDPIRGFLELKRVVKPGGYIYLLEHVRIDHPVIGRFMDLLNPLFVRLSGANINRKTVETVNQVGFIIERIEHLGPMKMVKFIKARIDKND